MRHVHHTNWYQFNSRTWYVNANKNGLYTHLLRPILERFDFMLKSHSKVFVFRFDLSVPQYTLDNKQLSHFGRRLRKRIARHYQTKDIVFCWVREQEKSKRQHYHCVLLLDGNKVNHPHKLNAWITDITDSLELSPQWVKYHNIRSDKPNYEQDIQAATYHVSYLAKARGKGHRPPQVKDFSISRRMNKTPHMK